MGIRKILRKSNLGGISMKMVTIKLPKWLSNIVLKFMRNNKLDKLIDKKIRAYISVGSLLIK